MKLSIFLLCVLGCSLLAPMPGWAGPDTPSLTEDVYYKTGGIPQGPPAAETGATYPHWQPLNNRIIIWLVTQQHTYFGGFVLALPLFAFLLEFLGTGPRHSPLQAPS